MDEWTVVDEYNKRLGAIMDQYEKDIEAADDKQLTALVDLSLWFNEHYDGQHDVPWPKEG